MCTFPDYIVEDIFCQITVLCIRILNRKSTNTFLQYFAYRVNICLRRGFTESITELYNDGGIRIIGKTVDENSFWDTAILLYIENQSGNNVGITVDDLSINGFMFTPYFSTTVYDGKKCIYDITIMSSELEENGIESIDEVELKFRIYNSDSYETIAESDPITFSAK